MQPTVFHRHNSPVRRRRFLAMTAAGSLGAWTFGRLGSLAAQAAPKLKAAVIGHTGRGDYGHGLEGIFSNLPGIEIAALADPDPQGRAQTAARIGAARTYADYRELLEKERPDLVSIAMRQAGEHRAIALAALRAGAHLYCEKPFTTAPAEADEVLALSAKQNRRIAVAHTMRMMPVVVRLRRAIAEGLLGELVEARAFGKQDARAGGEDMMVLGSHLFDLMRLFLGNPLDCSARVLWRGRDIARADARRVADDVGPVAGDRVFARFSFPDGVNASFTSDARLRDTVGHWGIEFLGSRGAARINCDIAPNAFIRRSTPWTGEGRTDSWQPLDPALVPSTPPHNLGPVGDWLEAIRAGREPECSGKNGAWAVEMVAAVYRAALAGGRVTFPLARRTHPLTG